MTAPTRPPGSGIRSYQSPPMSRPRAPRRRPRGSGRRPAPPGTAGDGAHGRQHRLLEPLGEVRAPARRAWPAGGSARCRCRARPARCGPPGRSRAGRCRAARWRRTSRMRPASTRPITRLVAPSRVSPWVSRSTSMTSSTVRACATELDDAACLVLLRLLPVDRDVGHLLGGVADDADDPAGAAGLVPADVALGVGPAQGAVAAAQPEVGAVGLAAVLHGPGDDGAHAAALRRGHAQRQTTRGARRTPPGAGRTPRGPGRPCGTDRRPGPSRSCPCG
ncbi:hypothetical protein STENM36S_03294 [Streptomyces tendae]